MKDYRYLLLFRWVLINLFGFFLLGMAYIFGGVHLVIVSDTTYLSVLIFVVFLWGLVLSGFKIWGTSQELNYAKNSIQKSKWKKMIDSLEAKNVDHSRIIESLKLKMFSRISFVKWIANSLTLLGLIGTVVGFIIALSGINPTLVSDISFVGRLISYLIVGLGTALYTTLVGGVLFLWLSANYQLLLEGTANLLATLLESKPADGGTKTVLVEATNKNE